RAGGARAPPGAAGGGPAPPPPPPPSRPDAAYREACPHPWDTSPVRRPHRRTPLSPAGGPHALAACGMPAPPSDAISRTCASPSPCVGVFQTAPAGWSWHRTGGGSAGIPLGDAPLVPTGDALSYLLETRLRTYRRRA